MITIISLIVMLLSPLFDCAMAQSPSADRVMIRSITVEDKVGSRASLSVPGSSGNLTAVPADSCVVTNNSGLAGRSCCKIEETTRTKCKSSPYACDELGTEGGKTWEPNDGVCGDSCETKEKASGTVVVQAKSNLYLTAGFSFYIEETCQSLGGIEASRGEAKTCTISCHDGQRIGPNPDSVKAKLTTQAGEAFKNWVGCKKGSGARGESCEAFCVGGKTTTYTANFEGPPPSNQCPSGTTRCSNGSCQANCSGGNPPSCVGENLLASSHTPCCAGLTACDGFCRRTCTTSCPSGQRRCSDGTCKTNCNPPCIMSGVKGSGTCCLNECNGVCQLETCGGNQSCANAGESFNSSRPCCIRSQQCGAATGVCKLRCGGGGGGGNGNLGCCTNFQGNGAPPGYSCEKPKAACVADRKCVWHSEWPHCQ